MIETRLDHILDLVKSGHILTEGAFAAADLHEALTMREFNYEHRSFYLRELEARWRILPLHPDLRGIVDELEYVTNDVLVQELHIYNDCDSDRRSGEELVSSLVFHIQNEICEIAKSRVTEYHTEWYRDLWKIYQQDHIPILQQRPYVERALQPNAAKLTVVSGSD